jgi:phenylacetic acid degradation operon negative regulatory protein
VAIDGAILTFEPTGNVTTERPFSARSLIASVLLGTHPPRLRGRLMVSLAEPFGLTAGAVRTAMSRMVTAGELVVEGGNYSLAGRLLDRQVSQDSSRQLVPRAWSGQWDVAIVVATGRSQHERVEVRRAFSALKLAERREGVWMRPANLPPGSLPTAERLIDNYAERYVACPHRDPVSLVADLWDLDAWQERTDELRRHMGAIVDRLESGDEEALASGFVTAAAVLRHLVADPMLPSELTPARWSPAELRSEYERYDVAFRSVLRAWFRAHR